MKKRLISLLLVLSLALGSTIALASCDGGGDDETVDNNTSTETESVLDTDKATESNDEDTDKVTESDKTTENNTESDAQVPSETEPTQVPSETEPTQVPSETEPTQVPSETEPAEVPSETEPESETGCDGNHYAATDDQGHYLDACDFCGTEGNATMEVHEYKTVNGMPTCKVCGWVASCQGVHNYDKTKPEGHFKPACDACGKGEGKIQDHEYEEKVEDEGDLIVYTLKCTVCGYRAYEQEVPYEINAFYSASDLAYTDMAELASLQGSFAIESGIGYAAYSSKTGGSAAVIVASNGEIGDPSGHYLVIKVRVPKSQSGFTASIRSMHANDFFVMSFTNIGSGWVTLIVDATKAVGTNSGYQPDSSNEYYLDGLRINAIAGPGETFDVAYVMMCDTIEDAQSFVESDGAKSAVILYTDIVNEAPTVDKNQCVDAYGNPITHEYIINDDGTHTMNETCYQCGLTAVKNEPHAYAQTVIDGDYFYACSACGSLMFGAKINKYISAEQVNTSAATYFRITQRGVFTDEESGKTYASFAGKGDIAQILFARNTNDSSPTEEANAFDVGSAGYFIIKMRTTSPSVRFRIAIGTDGDGTSDFDLPMSMATANEWVVYVVDFKTIIPANYAPDANGNFRLTQFYYNIGSTDFTSKVVYDIQYNAFVDTWEEVAAIVEDEIVVNVSAPYMGSLVYTEDKICVTDHAYTAKAIEGDYRRVCSVCGHVEYNYNVKADAAGIFMGPDYFLSIPEENYQINKKEVLTDPETGIPYYHMEDISTKNGFDWGDLSLYNSDANPTAGRYFVIKFRRPESDLNNPGPIYFWFTSVAGFPGDWPYGEIDISLPDDGEWHTVVVDLGAKADRYSPDGNGNYGPRTIHMRPLGFGDACNSVTNESFDIAYMAFFDDMGDLKDIVSETTYEWFVDKDMNSIRYTANNGCIGTHAVEETVEDGTYTYVCTVCGQTVDKITVPESVTKYYSAKDISNNANEYYSPGHNGTRSLLNYSDVSYAAITNMRQVIWQRNNLDMAETQSSSAAQRFTVNVGNANYLVIKIKSSDAAAWSSISLSTTAKNGDTVTADKDYNDYFGTDGKQGVLEGEEYISSWGCTSANILKAGDATGEWITYVIDLAAVYGDYYSKAEGEDDYVVDFFVLELEGAIDISYIAFVEGDWEDIAEVTGESKVTQITSLDGTSKTVSTADGSEIVPESDENE